MDRERRLRKKAEFLSVQRQGRWWANSLAVIRVLPNELGANRFGFLVSRRVGEAVVRNLVKRRLKEIVRRETLREGFDVVFIARPGLREATFKQTGDAVRNLLRRSRVALPVVDRAHVEDGDRTGETAHEEEKREGLA